MIRQHFFQNQRLKSNHERLLERYFRLLPQPAVSEFRTFGSSSLPGRNYHQHLRQIDGKTSNQPNEITLLSRSRAQSPNREIDFWIEKERKEYLPKAVNSIIEHRRAQQNSLVHADKFEPVKIYDHPIFGPTPAYIKPIFKDKFHSRTIDVKDEENDQRKYLDFQETKRQIDDENQRRVTTIDLENDDHFSETKMESTIEGENLDSEEKMPPGYISYKKWKEKYQDLIPVNPLVFNLYSQRTKNSIQAYGRSLSSLSDRIEFDETLTNRRSPSFSSSTESLESKSDDSDRRLTSYSPLSSSHYDKLNPQPTWKPPLTSRPIPTKISKNLSEQNNETKKENDQSPPESPVPFLSRTVPILSGSNPSESIDEKKSSFSFPDKPMSSENLQTSTDSSAPLTSTNVPNASNIPPAPPLPPFLMGNLSNSNQPKSTIKTTIETSNSNSTGIDQIPSTVSAADLNTGGLNTKQKVVTFGDNSTMKNPPVEDELSSIDSDDSAPTKKRKKKQKRGLTGLPDDNSSSSDE